MSLHHELARVADRAPVADVPLDTWSRARRARRRERAGRLAAAAAAVALLAGLASNLPARTDPPVADTDSLGVPDHLHGVPEDLTGQDGEGDWVSDRVTDELAVGPAAAAYVVDSGLPVVVGAADGRYHLLDLPDFTGNQFLMAAGAAGPALALSLDGGRLAYSYGVIGPDAATEPIPSGVRVVDLATGAVEEMSLTAGEGTAVTGLAWSPDGRWLVWAGQVARSWTAASYGAERFVVGRIAPGGARAGTVEVDHDELALAVDDRGTVSWVLDGRLRRWDGERPASRTELRLPGFPGRGVVLLDGSLALGTTDGLSVVLVGTDGRTTTVDAAGSRPPVGGGSTDVLGTVGTRLLVRTQALDTTPGELLLLDVDGSSRSVGVVEHDVPGTLSLAVDLMSTDRPTVDRTAPEWPWSEERWAATICVGAAAFAVVVWGLVLLRRRRVPA